MEDFFSYLAWGVMALFLIYISANANKQNITEAERREKLRQEKEEKEKSEQQD